MEGRGLEARPVGQVGGDAAFVWPPPALLYDTAESTNRFHRVAAIATGAGVPDRQTSAVVLVEDAIPGPAAARLR